MTALLYEHAYMTAISKLKLQSIRILLVPQLRGLVKHCDHIQCERRGRYPTLKEIATFIASFHIQCSCPVDIYLIADFEYGKPLPITPGAVAECECPASASDRLLDIESLVQKQYDESTPKANKQRATIRIRNCADYLRLNDHDEIDEIDLGAWRDRVAQAESKRVDDGKVVADMEDQEVLPNVVSPPEGSSLAGAMRGLPYNDDME
jgi:hypothetical protein